MSDIIGRSTYQSGAGDFSYLDCIIGNKAVTAHDKLYRYLALTNAAIAHDENAVTEKLHENAVAGDSGSELNIKGGDKRRNKIAGVLLGSQERNIGVTGGICHHIGYLKIVANDNNRRL